MSNLFTGLKVLDFGSNAAAPSATAMLADFGANVFKIERPGLGDDNRSYGPFIEGHSLLAMWFNRSKKSLAMDMKHPKAKELVMQLAKEADVVVESFRPGVIAKMGFSYDDIVKINPNVIMCSVSAFGQYGPYAQKAGYDLMAQAMSGIMSLSGPVEGPPCRVGTAIGDFCGGFHAFAAISAALYHRERTGEGQYIDISLLDGLMVANEYCDMAFNGFEVKRTGNHHTTIAPFGLFEGNDGSLMIGTVGEPLWRKLCALMGTEHLLEDPGFANSGLRSERTDILTPIVEKWLKSFPTIEEARKVLDDNGIPCGKVNSLLDLMDDPQIRAREMIVDLQVPYISQKTVKARGNYLKFSKTKPEMRPVPNLGEHTEEVLRSELGLSKEAIEQLAAEGVFGEPKGGK